MRKSMVFVALALILILPGCNTAASLSESDGTDPIVTTAAVMTSADAIATKEAAVTTALETIATTPTLPPNTSGKVEIRTIAGSLVTPLLSFLITSVDNETVALNPAQMPRRNELLINPVLIAMTSTEDDQNDPEFVNSYDCEVIDSEEADVTVGDFHIYSIQSSYRDDVISDFSGNNLVVVEINGLRIVHMGDIGQTFLTDEQLEALGEIDIAFMQFENTRSSMSLKNEKGFTLIEQLNPKIIIPTRFKEACIPILTEKYGDITYFDDVLAIGPEDLPEDTLNVYMMRNNYLFD